MSFDLRGLGWGAKCSHGLVNDVNSQRSQASRQRSKRLADRWWSWPRRWAQWNSLTGKAI